MAKKKTTKKTTKQGKKKANGKIDYSNPAQVKKLKNTLLKDYLAIKKILNDHEKEITKFQFTNQTDWHSYHITAAWGNYTNLKDHAEDPSVDLDHADNN